MGLYESSQKVLVGTSNNYDCFNGSTYRIYSGICSGTLYLFNFLNNDVAFNKNGDFYWTSILTGEVAGFSHDGIRVVAANLGPGVNPITFSDDGRLFVAQCFFGDGLYEVDPLGEKEPRSIRDDLGLVAVSTVWIGVRTTASMVLDGSITR